MSSLRRKFEEELREKVNRSIRKTYGVQLEEDEMRLFLSGIERRLRDHYFFIEELDSSSEIVIECVRHHLKDFGYELAASAL